MNAAISVLYMIEGCIFMAVAYILLYRHSPYPDFKTGYHVSSAMESKDAWEYANKKLGMYAPYAASYCVRWRQRSVC